MTPLLVLAFGFLLLAFFYGLYRLWRVHRRAQAREKQLALRMMQETWSRSEDE